MKTHRCYKTRAWRRVRRATLERDHFRCQIGFPGCKGRADSADHIVELEEGGEWYAMSNLQAACRSCNIAKRNKRIGREKGQRRSW